MERSLVYQQDLLSSVSPPALPEPDMSLSAHPAPIDQPVVALLSGSLTPRTLCYQIPATTHLITPAL